MTDSIEDNLESGSETETDYDDETKKYIYNKTIEKSIFDNYKPKKKS